MNQFDVVRNPITGSKGIYPFVINLQSNVSRGLKLQIVAPMTLPIAPATMSRNLMPEVQVGGQPYMVIMAQITTMRLETLGSFVVSGESARARLLAAMDFLFFGI